MSSGIYRIRNILDDKRYIGGSVDIQQRWAAHLCTLRCGQHHNGHIQKAFDKYGEGAFVFEVLEYVAPEMLIEREQYYFDLLKPEYNIAPTAGSQPGVPRTEETKQRISAARMGQHPSEEARKKMSEAKMGNQNHVKPHSEKTKQKISDANSGERSYNYGKHLSKETKQKISEARMDKHPSEETKQKLSEAKTGERHPMYGKHHSEETKRKMSAAQKKRWRRIRESKN